eukprot:TRINITY_DN620_c0_g1_i2.p1 TRINITY_DN620_c0_g1~~TRINITY_DN620_c0_g1_i2.p1  ORF type:complete len:384 (-),score=51.68 TRINITY_DN620_c0_g1_i2:126-1277(-)
MNGATATFTRRGTSFSINDVPSEILVHIFSQLSPFSDISYGEGFRYYHPLVAVSLVCKQWNQLCLEPAVWEDYELTLHEDTFPKDITTLVNPKYNKIHSLSFHGSYGDKPPHHYAHVVFGVYQKCDECLPVVNKLTEAERKQIKKISESLTDVMFSNCKIEKRVFQKICNLSQLSDLSINATSFDWGTSFERFTKLTTLKVLSFDFSYVKSWDASFVDLFGELTNLETLYFYNLPLTENLSNLAKLSKLKDLKLYNLSEIDETFFEGLASLTQIQCLSLHMECDEDDFDFEYTLPRPLPKLKELTIETAIPEERVISFLTPFLANLEYISFRGEAAVSREIVSEMISLSPHLRKVGLSYRGINVEYWFEIWEKYHDKVDIDFF